MKDDIKFPPLPYPQIPGNDYNPRDMWDYARAAIAKATGGNMTKETTLTDDAIHNLIVDLEIECDCGIEATPMDNIVSFARAIEQAVLQSPEMQVLRSQDPLQPAANWLCETIVECKAADIQSALRIGYNRAQRLHAAAMEQQK